MKSAVTYLIGRLGYEITPKWRMQRLAISTHLRRLFELKHIDCVIDVGANKGQYRDFLRRDVGFRGQILSFEPISALALALKDRARTDSKWAIYQLALGSTTQTLPINVMSASDFSSFLKPDHTAVKEFYESNTIARTELVQMERLDAVISSFESENRGFQRYFLKLDTQGFDLEALKGSEESLQRIPGLQTEVSQVPIYKGMPTMAESLSYLNDRNFQISAMFPVTFDRHLRAIEFDCVMVNTSLT